MYSDEAGFFVILEAVNEMERVREKLPKSMFNCFIHSLVTKTETELMEMTMKVTKIAFRVEIMAGSFGGSFIIRRRMTTVMRDTRRQMMFKAM